MKNDFRINVLVKLLCIDLTPGLPEKTECFGFPPWDFFFDTSQHETQVNVVYSPEK